MKTRGKWEKKRRRKRIPEKRTISRGRKIRPKPLRKIWIPALGRGTVHSKFEGIENGVGKYPSTTASTHFRH